MKCKFVLYCVITEASKNDDDDDDDGGRGTEYAHLQHEFQFKIITLCIAHMPSVCLCALFAVNNRLHTQFYNNSRIQ